MTKTTKATQVPAVQTVSASVLACYNMLSVLDPKCRLQVAQAQKAPEAIADAMEAIRMLAEEEAAAPQAQAPVPENSILNNPMYLLATMRDKAPKVVAGGGIIASLAGTIALAIHNPIATLGVGAISTAVHQVGQLGQAAEMTHGGVLKIVRAEMAEMEARLASK
jgi:hypothetical protein